MIERMYFFANGNYAALDSEGNQVSEEQGSAWVKVLQEKLDRRVIDENTRVMMSGWELMGKAERTVRELLERGDLKRKE